MDIPTVNLDDFAEDEKLLSQIPLTLGKEFNCWPVALVGDCLTLAIQETSADMEALAASIRTHLNDMYTIDFVYASATQIEAKLDWWRAFEKECKEVFPIDDTVLGGGDSGHYVALDRDPRAGYCFEDFCDPEDIPLPDTDYVLIEPTKFDEGPNPEKLFCLVLLDAEKMLADEIHIEVYEWLFRVRYKKHGELFEAMKPPIGFRDAFVAQCKKYCGLDVMQKTKSQSKLAKFQLPHKNRVKFLVSTMPTVYGEKIVMIRVRPHRGNLVEMGFLPQQLDQLDRIRRLASGLIVVNGSYNSGKTTTLMGLLGSFNDTSRNLTIICNTAEFELAGVQVVLANGRQGYLDALALAVAQNSEVICLDQVVDDAVAHRLVELAAHGKLVLTRLNFPDGEAVRHYFESLGVKKFLLDLALKAVISQRLLLRQCSDCQGARRIDGKKCRECSGSGHLGLSGIYEIMMPADRQPTPTLAAVARIKQESGYFSVEQLKKAGLL